MREAELVQQSLHERVAAWSLEWKYAPQCYRKVRTKALSQHPAGAVQSRFDGFFLYSKQARSLPRAELLDIPHDENDAESRRQTVNRVLQYFPDLGLGSRALRITLARRQRRRMDRPWRAFLRSMQHVEIEHGTPASLASNCLIQNNAGEPGSQAGSRAKISQASEDPHVGFLHGIFGFLIVQQHAARNAVQVLVVAPD
jgi:hypothetical protein